jgi:hypothetical protein
MEPSRTSADSLPELYRAVLDAATELERRGERREAGEVRRRAVEAYAVWDEAAERRLIRLLQRARAMLDGRPEETRPDLLLALFSR